MQNSLLSQLRCAEVAFKSHASVMAVCEYCQSTVMKDADAVKDIGKMSAVLEDYSPHPDRHRPAVLGGQHFTADRPHPAAATSAGLWNEWYLMFDDGRTGWLGDSVRAVHADHSRRKPSGALPAFRRLHAGPPIHLLGQLLYRRPMNAARRCIGGQGELPFRVGEGWQARMADFRSRRELSSRSIIPTATCPALMTARA